MSDSGASRPNAATSSVTAVSRTASLIAIIAALIAETSLVALAATGAITMPLVTVVHLGVVALLVLMLHRPLFSGADGGFALLAVISIFATGPFGAAGALVFPLLARRNAASEALLPAWYERVALSAEQDTFTKLSDRVAIGRAANLAAALPQPFVQLFESGPIADQQTALGMIARGFHPGYLPVLKLALDSPQPVIRVQAAAVAARIRGQLNDHVVTLFVRAADPTSTTDTALDIAAELRAALDSGLLEAAHQSKAGDILEGLLALTFARIDAQRRDRKYEQTSTPASGNDDVAELYAAHLLAAGRFADFRNTRFSVRRPVHGRYCHRVVRSRRPRANFKQQLVAISVRP